MCFTFKELLEGFTGTCACCYCWWRTWSSCRSPSPSSTMTSRCAGSCSTASQTPSSSSTLGSTSEQVCLTNQECCDLVPGKWKWVTKNIADFRQWARSNDHFRNNESGQHWTSDPRSQADSTWLYEHMVPAGSGKLPVVDVDVDVDVDGLHCIDVSPQVSSIPLDYIFLIFNSVRGAPIYVCIFSFSFNCSSNLWHYLHDLLKQQ